ncbi:hypothetical protein ACFO5T_14875 [Dokdonia genika]|uniref:Uncharacterized protein n=1 Tax=Dokdonia genika TaxID=308113 RepID=A0ABV9LE86_9FLAO
MFGQNFVRIKSKYSIELIKTDIKLSEYKINKFRSTLLQNTISARESEKSNNAYFLEVPKSLFYKSILSEFEQYYVRSLLQLSDFTNMETNINDSWKYTTYYYSFFFSNVALQRYLQKGYFYLDTGDAKNLSSILSAIMPFSVSIGSGNWHFKKTGESLSNVEIEITKVGGNVHQLVWQDLKSTLKLFEQQSARANNTVENTILTNLYRTIKSNQNFSPSEVRNYLNYVSEISIEELNNKIRCPQIKEADFIKNLSAFNYNNSYESKIKFSILLGQYLNSFNRAIIEDIELKNSTSFKLKKKYKRKSIS